MSCVRERVYADSPLSAKVALFNHVANNHIQKQAINPFSNDNVGSMTRPQFSKDEYGKPEKGSKSETRGCQATQHICKEMLELCEMIDQFGTPLFSQRESPNDPRLVISFGELFIMYTVISDKLVGMLLRARKHKIIDFEGEVLFQRKDDHVPIILLKPIEEIRAIFKAKIDEAQSVIDATEEESNNRNRRITDNKTPEIVQVAETNEKA